MSKKHPYPQKTVVVAKAVPFEKRSHYLWETGLCLFLCMMWALFIG